MPLEAPRNNRKFFKNLKILGTDPDESEEFKNSVSDSEVSHKEGALNPPH